MNKGTKCHAWDWKRRGKGMPDLTDGDWMVIFVTKQEARIKGLHAGSAVDFIPDFDVLLDSNNVFVIVETQHFNTVAVYFGAGVSFDLGPASEEAMESALNFAHTANNQLDPETISKVCVLHIMSDCV